MAEDIQARLNYTRLLKVPTFRKSCPLFLRNSYEYLHRYMRYKHACNALRMKAYLVHLVTVISVMNCIASTKETSFKQITSFNTVNVLAAYTYKYCTL